MQKCKGEFRGRDRGRGRKISQISGLRFRLLVAGFVRSDSGTNFADLPLPRPLPLEILLHLCTGRRPVCTFAL